MTTKSVTPSTVKYGDVNCDDSVDVADAVLLARMLAEDPEANVSADGKVNADCNDDGNLTADDTIRILRHIANIVA